jgi:8-oxo-dGTP pyrophosphatase MutT (NUDIX family)
VTLHADAVRVLTEWTPPDPEQGDLKQRFLDLLRAEPGAVRADHPDAHITASVLVVDGQTDRVLLCLHGRIHRWVQLGGHLEPEDPSLVAAGLREATEESGIDGLQIHPVPIHLDVHRVNCRYGPVDHYDVRFAAIAPSGAVERVSEESTALGWFAPLALPHPMATATEPLIGPALAVARRLRAEAGRLRSSARRLGA